MNDTMEQDNEHLRQLRRALDAHDPKWVERCLNALTPTPALIPIARGMLLHADRAAIQGVTWAGGDAYAFAMGQEGSKGGETASETALPTETVRTRRQLTQEGRE